MKAFNLRLDTLILRFYLIMLVVIIAGFSGMWALAFLALPIFMTCMWGIDFGFRQLQGHTKSTTQRIGSWIRLLRIPVHHTA